MTRKKWIVTAICLAVTLSIIFAGIFIWQHTAFQEMPFGYRYGISSYFYTSELITAVSPETPVYGLSATGKLYHILGGESRLTGSMREFQLSEENFDSRFVDDDDWRVIGLDAKSAREQNAQAWRYTALDGRFRYLLLQENGDVFLCVGENKEIELFMWLQPLDQY